MAIHRGNCMFPVSEDEFVASAGVNEFSSFPGASLERIKERRVTD